MFPLSSTNYISIKIYYQSGVYCLLNIHEYFPHVLQAEN